MAFLPNSKVDTLSPPATAGLPPSERLSGCIQRLQSAFVALGVAITERELGQMAKRIVRAMGGPNRNFHDLEHAFKVADGGDGLETLAALFHDVVYVQIDGDLNPEFAPLLTPFIEASGGRQMVREQIENLDDCIFALVLTIFDVQLGQHLAMEQNEFLSALAAAKQLEDVLDVKAIAVIVACIEATIPFRPPTPDGLTPSDLLYQKLVIANDKFSLGWDETYLVAVVQRAVRVSNRDVENFASQWAADFLSNTWNLLPESNACLRDTENCTIGQYRHVLEKTASFMYYLNAPLVFRQFRGEPGAVDFEGLLQQANKNLVVARLYLNIKLLAIAILESLAHCSKGSSLEKLSQMSFVQVAKRVKQYQDTVPPDAPYRPRNLLEQEVLALLQTGRSQPSTFDLRSSPMAAFLVKQLGMDQMVARLDRAKALFQDNLSAKDFLSEFDPEAIARIELMLIQACG
ncbi:MAG: hypothetical protein AAF728_12795 [Cyanobacteria bacterium P01_D01_bin.128]